MRKPMTAMLLLLTLLTSACSAPQGAAPAAVPEPTPPERQYASHSTPDLLSSGSVLAVRAEPVWRASVGGLLADPKGGVWGLQDGSLLHFQARPGDWFERTTFGRPDAASFGSGELVWLEPGQLLAGWVTSARLVRLHPDGTLDELGPARSSEGVPFSLLNQWGGQLYLQDARGSWYTLAPEGSSFLPVVQKPGQHRGVADTPERVREALAQAGGGEVHWLTAQLVNGTAYGVVSQIRLFTYEVESGRFAWVGDPVRAGSLRLFGSLDGQILADMDWKRLVLIDPETGERYDQGPSDGVGLLVYLDEGLVYRWDALIDLRTGDQRRLAMPRMIGGISASVRTEDGRLIVGTGHGGQLVSIDLAAGAGVDWGRPIPELGQESGEEAAPISGLALGGDGLLYVAVGSGASGLNESRLVRIDPATGQVLDQTLVREVISSLLTGADGQVYAILSGRVAVIHGW